MSHAVCNPNGLTFTRVFSSPDVSPYDQIEWETRSASIKDEKGNVIFEQTNVEVPSRFSMLATNILASKYFYGPYGSPQRETSYRQVVFRVVSTIASAGRAKGYFASEDDAKAFEDDLAWLLLNQYGAFNSPVWFNVGLWHVYGVRGNTAGWRWDDEKGEAVQIPEGESYVYPQGSACFIQGIEDNMESIFDLVKSEAMLFKYGSGTGTDLTKLRSTREKLSGGGTPSGPLSFFKVFDTVAGIVKSGGKCLALDQPVFTDSGVKTAGELADSGNDFIVLSYSKRLGRVAAKKASAWRSGHKVVVEVVTDKGKFRVSSDHPFMLRNGVITRASDLVPGMSLFPVNTYRHNHDYVQIGLQDGMKGVALMHRVVAKDILNWDILGMSVHHKNGDKVDNRPENLEAMTQAEHAGLHGRENGAFYTEGMPGERNGMHSGSAFWQDQEKVKSYTKKQSDILKRRNPGELAKLAGRQRALNTAYELINAGYDISTFEKYVTARKAVIGRSGYNKNPLQKLFSVTFKSYDDFYKEVRAGNHEVISVTPVGLEPVVSVEVYDDEPDDKRPWTEHNYAIAPVGSSSPYVSCVVSANTRRAARMQTLRDWHPDILDFIDCKYNEEKKAKALIAQGYESNFNGEAYSSVAFQNTNISIRLSDMFMKACENGGDWTTREVTTGKPVDTFPAADMLDRIADRSWYCGDPGVQFEDTIQRWHTIPNTAPIDSSNPCLRRGSRLYTANGWMKVEDLVDKDFEVFDGVGFTKGKAWATGKKPIVRLHLNSGETVDVTPDHRIYTSDGWVCAAESDGKTVPRVFPSPAKSPENQLPRAIRGVSGRYYSTSSSDLMEALGFLQGDGGIRPNGAVTVYYTPEKDGDFVHNSILPIFQDIAASKGEVDYQAQPLSDGRSGYVMCRERLANWLLALGFGHKSLPERTLPEFVWSLTQAAQGAFLRGLFGANGNILVDSRHAVVLVSTCRKMLQEVQLLLRTMGIMSSVRIHNKAQDVEWHNGTYTSKESYHLEITHQSDIFTFSRLVGFPQECQADRLKRIVHPGRASDRDSAFLRRASATVVKVESLEIEDDVFDFTAPTTAMGVCDGVLLHNCSEYMHVDDSACNLASINLMKFRRSDGVFDVDRFRDACRTFITAQEIIVGLCGYPTKKIAENSHKSRPLGLGYANIGALLMSMGLPYDSDEGRGIAASITAIMQGAAGLQSATTAFAVGAFEYYAANRDAMLNVVKMHYDAAVAIPADDYLKKAAVQALGAAFDAGKAYGYRNGQLSVLAPCGTIGFLMDCDTTGVEPDIALVKYKVLAGGGMLKIVNNTVPLALRTLGYHEKEVEDIIDYVNQYDTIVGSGIQDKHLPVFDCAFAAANDPTKRSIHYMGHIRMMAAVQPFLSGAISKTVNMPKDATKEDIKEAIVQGWKLGLKALAIYRDGSKDSQPLNTSVNADAKAVDPNTARRNDALRAILDSVSKEAGVEFDAKAEAFDAEGLEKLAEWASSPSRAFARAMKEVQATPAKERRRLPDTRRAITHKFSIQGHEGYVSVGLFDDGSPGELFITMAKEGSTIGGLVDAIGTLTSISLQYNVPLATLVDKFAHTRFEPVGFTKNRDIPIAKSVVDYIFRWMGMQFLPGYWEANSPVAQMVEEGETPVRDHAALVAEVQKRREHKAEPATAANGNGASHAKVKKPDDQYASFQSDAPACWKCGSITVRGGTCYKCFNCGESMGCS